MTAQPGRHPQVFVYRCGGQECSIRECSWSCGRPGSTLVLSGTKNCCSLTRAASTSQRSAKKRIIIMPSQAALIYCAA